MSELRVDVGHASSPLSLQEIFAALFCFPGWYGMNWDAFWESATDPEQSQLPAILVLLSFDVLEERLPNDARILREILPDLAQSRSVTVIALNEAGSEVARWSPCGQTVPDAV